VTPERWREIERVCDHALEREPEDRAAFIRTACAGDEPLRVEVESLLACREQAGHFLEAPALEVVARAEAQVLSAPPARSSAEPLAGPGPGFFRRQAWWVWGCALPLLLAAASLHWVVLTGPEPAGWYLRQLPVPLNDMAGEVRRVTPGSPAARAGFEQGDFVSGPDLDRFLSRQQAGVTHRFHVLRRGERHALSLVIGPKNWAFWQSPPGRIRVFFLFTAELYLALAAVLLFNRSEDRTARWGAVLIGQFGFEILLLAVEGQQLRFIPEAAEAMRALPAPLTLLAVSALCLSLMVPAGAFGFCAVFPRPRPMRPAAWRWLGIAASSTIFVQLDFFWLPIYWSIPTPWFVLLGMAASLVLGVGYIAWAVALLSRNYRRIESRNERRRIRLVALGFSVSLSAFAVNVLLATPWASLDALRGSSMPLVMVVFYVAAPLCTTYAMLRHRVFDIHVMVRMGLRYAAARGVLLSIVPATGMVFVFDVLTNRDLAVAAIAARRGVLYLALGAVALVLHLKRKAWLDALDRRFFRERHDARRLLRAIVEDIRHAEHFDDAARHVIARIDSALHPESVTLMVRRPGQPTYRPAAAMNSIVPWISASSRLVALARVLNRPVEHPQSVAPRPDAGLPREETEFLRRARIEWLFPVSFGDTGPEAFLLLGPKRSEEPYSSEDRELLEAVTSSLALLLERPAVGAPVVPGFAECSTCGACWDSGKARCANDGGDLVKSPYGRMLAGRYRFDRRLGRGGMGSVYLAFDVELQREVAVKVIRPEWLASPDAVGRFRREARAAALLSHPHVVTVHDFGVADDDRAYLVMERLNGRTLREALRQHGSLAAPLAREILRGVCAAVSLAHHHRLLHRDLKPENIFLARSDEGEIAKVLDFGLVKPLAPSQSDAVTGTATGGLLGTFGYMSPEQLRGEPPAESWDVWALAVVAFEMLTGTHPFALDGDSRGPFAAARAITLAPAPALAPALRGFFERALAAERALRPRSVHELIAQLDVALGVCSALPG
jgi:hypothetical protein